MDTATDVSGKNKIGLVIAETLIFGMIYVGVYALLLLIPFDFADALGLFRTFITAMLSKFLRLTENTEQFSMKLMSARSIVFSVVNIGVYVLLLLIPLPDVYGLLRAFITAIVSKIVEQVIFGVVRIVDA